MTNLALHPPSLLSQDSSRLWAMSVLAASDIESGTTISSFDGCVRSTQSSSTMTTMRNRAGSLFTIIQPLFLFFYRSLRTFSIMPMDIRSFFQPKKKTATAAKADEKERKRKSPDRLPVSADEFFSKQTVAKKPKQEIIIESSDDEAPVILDSKKAASPLQAKTTPVKQQTETLPSPPTETAPSPRRSARQATTPPSKKTPPTLKTKSTKTSRTSDTQKTLEQPTVRRSTPPSLHHTQCLLRNSVPLTFCFSGVLDNVSRESAQDMVKSLGGRVTTAVSSKTDYLVVGTVLEDGRDFQQGSKYKKAMELGTVVIVEGEELFYGLLQTYHDLCGPVTVAAAAAPLVKANPVASATATTTTTTTTKTNPYAKKASNPYATTAKANPYERKPAATATKSTTSTTTVTSDPLNSSMLWVDKYKPTSAREILGNQDAVRKLTQWLNSWERIFNTAQNSNKSFSAPGGPWKAALLSGPPGIGKTTTATLVAREAGRDVLEFNASDVRSKKALTNTLGDITGSRTIGFQAQNTKRCIIMDEVDGMGAGDRSGMAELIQMIKKSKVPIVCICNDRQSQKLKSLIPYCLDLRYRRPTKNVIANRAVQVGQQEGLNVEHNAAEALAESCGNDIRQVLNCLQMWSRKGNSLKFKDLKERESDINKDDILRVSLFDAAKSILEGRQGLNGSNPEQERNSFFRRHDAFFVDYSFTGLLVQQNYLKVLQNPFNEAKRKSAASQLEVLHRMSDAADSLSDYDLAENQLRGGQNWSLLPMCSSLVVKTGFHASGSNGGFLPGFPEFTAWLGKNSSKGKKYRLLSELQHHLNYSISGGGSETRLSYLPVLRERLLKLLQADNTEAAIQFMDEYGLDRDDVFEKLDEFLLSSGKASTFNDLGSKQKASFTRLYNQMAHSSQALVAEQGNIGKGKKRGSGGGAASMETKDPDAIDDDQVEEEDDDEEDEELDAEKIKAMFKSKGRGKSNKASAATSNKGGRKKK